jgi:hypothetical protein
MARHELDDRKLRKLIRDLPKQGDKFLRSKAQEIVDDIKLSFGTSPSSPGEPPGVDTGALRASMRFSKIRQLHYRVSDGVDYGIYLEVGTSTIAPRPFVAPVFEQHRKTLVRDAKKSGLFDV